MTELEPVEIIKQLNAVNTASVIFLPGTGQTSTELLARIKSVKEDFALPHVKFIIPTAPLRPYIPAKGELKHVWFNRYDVNPSAPEHVESLNDIRPKIISFIEEEIKSGISLSNIIIGGFSMGGAMALYTAYKFLPGFAGCFTLSSFLNDKNVIYDDIKGANTPLLMFQGNADTVVQLAWGENTFKKLSSLGVKGSFKIVDNVGHELQKDELEQLLEWIVKVLPPQ